MKSLSLWLGAIIFYLLSLLIVANDAFKNGIKVGDNRCDLRWQSQIQVWFYLQPEPHTIYIGGDCFEVRRCEK